MPDGWSEIDFSPFYYMQRAQHNSGMFSPVEMPLQNYLKDVYDTYVVAEDVDALRLLHPKYLILFYFHALQQEEYDIAYSLMGGENLPKFDQFEEIVQTHTFEFGSFDNVSYTGGTERGNETEATFSMQMHGYEIGITMVLQDDLYKVKYTSDNMFNMIDKKDEGDAPD